MALNGRLEDMNLLEILQIVAFSKKTGTLKVQSSMSGGAVLFREGVVYCAFSASTAPRVAQLSRLRLEESELRELEEQIRLSIRELTALREGRFEFELCTEIPTQWEGMEVSDFLTTGGVDPQQLMLELARELDVARRDSASMLESQSGGEASISHPMTEEETALEDDDLNVTVLVVDDEPQVLRMLDEEMSAAGSVVSTASGPQEALEHIRRLVAEGQHFYVITDVAMPSASGDHFQGGFEIATRLQELEASATVILIAEYLSPKLRTRAKELGIRKVAFKPALTKLDADEYEEDLRSFAKVVRRELALLAGAERESSEDPPTLPTLNYDVMFDFLKTMTDQLLHPGNGIARMLLRVAAKHTERALLFLVKGPRARGLAGVHLGRPAKLVVDQVCSMSFDLQSFQPFAEVVYSRSPVLKRHEQHQLPPEIEPGKAREYVLLPMQHHHEVLAILYCDNPNSGRAPTRLAGLELFLAQAGMAMENASLHRRLRSGDSKFSIENQGPLTQEFNRVLGNAQ
jgi:CheY-like chemotaxis protein